MSEIVLTPPYRLDSATAPGFEATSLANIAGSERALIDFSAVDFVSSAGLRGILMVAKRLRSKGGRLAVCGLRPAVAEVFAISGFSAILDIHPTRDQALAALRQ